MKPIIFSTPMVKKILSGEKCQTRRVIKPQPVGEIRQDATGDYGEDYGGGVALIKLPYKPSDVLWVRETWANLGWGNYIYRADDLKRYEHYQHWRPSIHMPREAARIFLRVTDVEAAMLQNIDNGDAESEGCFGIPRSCNGSCWYCLDTCWVESPAQQFRELWDSINAKRPEYQWDKNPWVWVISFERTET